MCSTHQPASVSTPATCSAGHFQTIAPCGCGCLGRKQAVANLNHYRDQLKIQLKSVDDRLAHLKASCPQAS